MAGPWLPKGERPGEAGLYWLKRGYGRVEGRPLVVRDNCRGRYEGILVIDDTLTYPISDPQYDDCRFAPATPPPEWDLVEALEGNFNTHYEWELLKHETLRIARAYLAGGPKP